MSAYRQAHRPSGSALTRARDAAVGRLEEASAAREAAERALETVRTAARLEAAELDARVRSAELERVRAMRLSIAGAKEVPQRLRDAVEREARAVGLERALGAKGEGPSTAVLPWPEAIASRDAARTERAQRASEAAIAIEAASIRLRRAQMVQEEAEADLRRLV